MWLIHVRGHRQLSKKRFCLIWYFSVKDYTNTKKSTLNLPYVAIVQSYSDSYIFFQLTIFCVTLINSLWYKLTVKPRWLENWWFIDGLNSFRSPQVRIYIETDPQWPELPLTGTKIHGPKGVRATEVSPYKFWLINKGLSVNVRNNFI